MGSINLNEKFFPNNIQKDLLYCYTEAKNKIDNEENYFLKSQYNAVIKNFEIMNSISSQASYDGNIVYETIKNLMYSEIEQYVQNKENNYFQIYFTISKISRLVVSSFKSLYDNTNKKQFFFQAKKNIERHGEYEGAYSVYRDFSYYFESFFSYFDELLFYFKKDENEKLALITPFNILQTLNIYPEIQYFISHFIFPRMQNYLSININEDVISFLDNINLYLKPLEKKFKITLIIKDKNKQQIKEYTSDEKDLQIKFELHANFVEKNSLHKLDFNVYDNIDNKNELKSKKLKLILGNDIYKNYDNSNFFSIFSFIFISINYYYFNYVLEDEERKEFIKNANSENENFKIENYKKENFYKVFFDFKKILDLKNGIYFNNYINYWIDFMDKVAKENNMEITFPFQSTNVYKNIIINKLKKKNNNIIETSKINLKKNNRTLQIFSNFFDRHILKKNLEQYLPITQDYNNDYEIDIIFSNGENLKLKNTNLKNKITIEFLDFYHYEKNDTEINFKIATLEDLYYFTKLKYKDTNFILLKITKGNAEEYVRYVNGKYYLMDLNQNIFNSIVKNKKYSPIKLNHLDPIIYHRFLEMYNDVNNLTDFYYCEQTYINEMIHLIHYIEMYLNDELNSLTQLTVYDKNPLKMKHFEKKEKIDKISRGFNGNSWFSCLFQKLKSNTLTRASYNLISTKFFQQQINLFNYKFTDIVKTFGEGAILRKLSYFLDELKKTNPNTYYTSISFLKDSHFYNESEVLNDMNNLTKYYENLAKITKIDTFLGFSSSIRQGFTYLKTEEIINLNERLKKLNEQTFKHLKNLTEYQKVSLKNTFKTLYTKNKKFSETFKNMTDQIKTFKEMDLEYFNREFIANGFLFLLNMCLKLAQTMFRYQKKTDQYEEGLRLKRNDDFNLLNFNKKKRNEIEKEQLIILSKLEENMNTKKIFQKPNTINVFFKNVYNSQNQNNVYVSAQNIKYIIENIEKFQEFVLDPEEIQKENSLLFFNIFTQKFLKTNEGDQIKKELKEKEDIWKNYKFLFNLKRTYDIFKFTEMKNYTFDYIGKYSLIKEKKNYNFKCTKVDEKNLNYIDEKCDGTKNLIHYHYNLYLSFLKNDIKKKKYLEEQKFLFVNRLNNNRFKDEADNIKYKDEFITITPLQIINFLFDIDCMKQHNDFIKDLKPYIPNEFLSETFDNLEFSKSILSWICLKLNKIHVNYDNHTIYDERYDVFDGIKSIFKYGVLLFPKENGGFYEIDLNNLKLTKIDDLNERVKNYKLKEIPFKNISLFLMNLFQFFKTKYYFDQNNKEKKQNFLYSNIEDSLLNVINITNNLLEKKDTELLTEKIKLLSDFLDEFKKPCSTLISTNSIMLVSNWLKTNLNGNVSLVNNHSDANITVKIENYKKTVYLFFKNNSYNNVDKIYTVILTYPFIIHEFKYERHLLISVGETYPYTNNLDSFPYFDEKIELIRHDDEESEKKMTKSIKYVKTLASIGYENKKKTFAKTFSNLLKYKDSNRNEFSYDELFESDFYDIINENKEYDEYKDFERKVLYTEEMWQNGGFNLILPKNENLTQNYISNFQKNEWDINPGYSIFSLQYLTSFFDLNYIKRNISMLYTYIHFFFGYLFIKLNELSWFDIVYTVLRTIQTYFTGGLTFISIPLIFNLIQMAIPKIIYTFLSEGKKELLYDYQVFQYYNDNVSYSNLDLSFDFENEGFIYNTAKAKKINVNLFEKTGNQLKYLISKRHDIFYKLIDVIYLLSQGIENPEKDLKYLLTKYESKTLICDYSITSYLNHKEYEKIVLNLWKSLKYDDNIKVYKPIINLINSENNKYLYYLNDSNAEDIMQNKYELNVVQLYDNIKTMQSKLTTAKPTTSVVSNISQYSQNIPYSNEFLNNLKKYTKEEQNILDDLGKKSVLDIYDSIVIDKKLEDNVDELNDDLLLINQPAIFSDFYDDLFNSIFDFFYLKDTYIESDFKNDPKTYKLKKIIIEKTGKSLSESYDISNGQSFDLNELKENYDYPTIFFNEEISSKFELFEANDLFMNSLKFRNYLNRKFKNIKNIYIVFEEGYGIIYDIKNKFNNMQLLNRRYIKHNLFIKNTLQKDGTVSKYLLSKLNINYKLKIAENRLNIEKTLQSKKENYSNSLQLRFFEGFKNHPLDIKTLQYRDIFSLTNENDIPLSEIKTFYLIFYTHYNIFTHEINKMDKFLYEFYFKYYKEMYDITSEFYNSYVGDDDLKKLVKKALNRMFFYIGLNDISVIHEKQVLYYFNETIDVLIKANPQIFNLKSDKINDIVRDFFEKLIYFITSPQLMKHICQQNGLDYTPDVLKGGKLGEANIILKIDDKKLSIINDISSYLIKNTFDKKNTRNKEDVLVDKSDYELVYPNREFLNEKNIKEIILKNTSSKNSEILKFFDGNEKIETQTGTYLFFVRFYKFLWNKVLEENISNQNKIQQIIQLIEMKYKGDDFRWKMKNYLKEFFNFIIGNAVVLKLYKLFYTIFNRPFFFTYKVPQPIKLEQNKLYFPEAYSHMMKFEDTKKTKIFYNNKYINDKYDGAIKGSEMSLFIQYQSYSYSDKFKDYFFNILEEKANFSIQNNNYNFAAIIGKKDDLVKFFHSEADDVRANYETYAALLYFNPKF